MDARKTGRASGMPHGTISEATSDDQRDADALAAQRVAAGDASAFSDIYERHFDGIYDFVARIVRDRELAADVVQVSFVKAWESLRAGSEVDHVKAWLYAIARNRAIDELRRRGRELPADTVPSEDGEQGLYDVPDESRRSRPEAVAEDRELAALVWEAACGLSPDDYSLLDMHLRRDLDADAMSAALGLKKGAVYTRLSRMKDALEESIGALLLTRRGRGGCAELDAIVATAEGAMDLKTRRAVNRHARECERCGERRRVLPAEILGALVPVPALPGVKEAVWSAVSGSVGSAAGGAGGAECAGVLKGGAAGKVKLAAGAAAVAGAVGAFLLLGGESPRDPDDVRSTSHRVEVASTNPVMRLSWTPPERASGYSVLWARDRAALPDTSADLPGEASGVTSPPLEAGRWYFVLRTRDDGGDWTATVTLGPFIIVGTEGPDRERDRDRQRRRAPGGGDGATEAPGQPPPASGGGAGPVPQGGTPPPAQQQGQQPPPVEQTEPPGPQLPPQQPPVVPP